MPSVQKVVEDYFGEQSRWLDSGLCCSWRQLSLPCPGVSGQPSRPAGRGGFGNCPGLPGCVVKEVCREFIKFQVGNAWMKKLNFYFARISTNLEITGFRQDFRNLWIISIDRKSAGREKLRLQ